MSPPRKEFIRKLVASCEKEKHGSAVLINNKVFIKVYNYFVGGAYVSWL